MRSSDPLCCPASLHSPGVPSQHSSGQGLPFYHQASSFLSYLPQFSFSNLNVVYFFAPIKFRQTHVGISRNFENHYVSTSVRCISEKNLAKYVFLRVKSDKQSLSMDLFRVFGSIEFILSSPVVNTGIERIRRSLRARRLLTRAWSKTKRSSSTSHPTLALDAFLLDSKFLHTLCQRQFVLFASATVG